MVYEISMGIRKDEPRLRAEVDRILASRRKDIARILDSYGVPQAR
jgi:mxaJ protein